MSIGVESGLKGLRLYSTPDRHVQTVPSLSKSVTLVYVLMRCDLRWDLTSFLYED